MRRLALVCVVVVAVYLVAVVGRLSWDVHRNHQIERAFKELPLGATKSDVTQRLGKPLDTSACIASFADKQICSHEMIYPSAFAPGLPTYWTFRFDDNGRLIDRYEFGSP